MSTSSKREFSTTRLWAGRILTGIITFILLGSAIAKLAGAPQMVEGLKRAGIPGGAILPIALLELTCLAVYLMPGTTVLGMLLLTGYFGGATVTHVIGRESFFPPLLIGLGIWAGAYLRVPELGLVLPLRRLKAQSDTPQRTEGLPELSKARYEVSE
jgi:hypothetical protein